MELAYNGITTKDSSLVEDITEAAKNGFIGIELRDYKLIEYLKKNSLESLNKIIKANCLKVLSINTLEIYYNSSEGKEFEKLKEKLLWLCKIADNLNVSYLVSAPLLNENSANYEDIRKDLIKLYKRLSDIASEYKVKLGFEFISHSNAMVPTLKKALEIIKEIDRDNVGLIFDIFAFYGNDSEIETIKEIPIEKLYLVHFNDAEKGIEKEKIEEKNRTFPGEGVVKYDEIIPALKSIGYNGTYSLELITPRVWEWDVPYAVKHSYETSNRVLSQYY